MDNHEYMRKLIKVIKTDIQDDEPDYMPSCDICFLDVEYIFSVQIKGEKFLDMCEKCRDEFRIALLK